MKVLTTISLVLLGFLGYSQPMIADATPVPTTPVKTGEEVEGDSAAPLVEFKTVNYLLFDTSLIPSADLYEYSWDSLHLDQPKVEPNDTGVAIALPLIEESCEYVHPCTGPVTSKFGWRRYRMHKGIDIDLVTGDPVYAAFDGVVRIAKYNYGGFGHYVVIRHYNGLETLYGHLSVRKVKPNQTVKAGQVIGLGGNTGRSTGSHLHFEVLYKGTQLDPSKVISFTNHELINDTLDIDIADFKYTAKYRDGRLNPHGVYYHRIRPGDSLWRISRRYGVSINYLCRMNGISRNTTLRIGRSLRVR